MKVKLQKIIGNLLDEFRKSYMSGTQLGFHLEIFSRPQAIGNSRKYLLLRTDILKKTVAAFRGRSNFISYL